jgi:hypothetical protein
MLRDVDLVIPDRRNFPGPTCELSCVLWSRSEEKYHVWSPKRVDRDLIVRMRPDTLRYPIDEGLTPLACEMLIDERRVTSGVSLGQLAPIQVLG